MHISIEQMYEEAANCDDCMQWHKHCNASCCRSFTLQFTRRIITYEGMLLSWKLPPRSQQHQDLKWYYKLHGVKIERGNKASMILRKHEWSGSTLIVYADCENLEKDLKCSGYPDNRPGMCEELNAETAHDGCFHLTEMCRFKFTK